MPTVKTSSKIRGEDAPQEKRRRHGFESRRSMKTTSRVVKAEAQPKLRIRTRKVLIGSSKQEAPSIKPLHGMEALALLKSLGIATENGQIAAAYR